MLYLKADTITEVTVGVAVAVGDGFTPVTSLVGASADEFEIIKHGATTTTTIAGTLAAIAGADGYYALDLSATDTDTEGRLVLLINDDSLILPIRHEFMVVNANVFDSLFAVAATDFLQVDITQIAGTTQDATDLADFAAAGYDPVTNKVQGVVLVDTTTANTDMRGTNSAALASVATEARLAELDAANLPTDIADIPTVAEFNARTLLAAGYFDPAADIVANVTTVATTTTNTDMRGTDSAALASVATEARLSELDEATAGKMANQVDIIQVDTTTDIPATITTLQSDTDDIQTRLPAALVSGRMDSNAGAINDNALAAIRLALSAGTIVIGAAATGTLSTTQMTTDLTEATDDHYNGRIIIWTSGVLKDQATNITDYAGIGGLLTFTAVTEAPSNTDSFVIV